MSTGEEGTTSPVHVAGPGSYLTAYALRSCLGQLRLHFLTRPPTSPDLLQCRYPVPKPTLYRFKSAKLTHPLL